MLRRCLAVVALLALSACNRVVTDHPLFDQADAVGAPVLKPGVWLLENKDSLSLMEDRDSDAPCEVDRRDRPSRWPECATFVVIEPGQIRSPTRDEGQRLDWDRQLSLLAAGDPVVLQVGDVDDKGEQSYLYFGVRPTTFAADGQVTALDLWTVDCGPPPPQDAGQPTRYLTWELLPGLTAAKDNCTTESAEAVRRAATASLSWQTPGRMVWAADRYR